ncbi:unnamed protein product [Paramecium sonneborni]|uniref:Transmembrane protein n=1 Tax=Paramecium sonneborni TaxID=65129 RepID=A0A8S1LX21_9CILI|nr:unnamed protein product [Paramecium sonneborni]
MNTEYQEQEFDQKRQSELIKEDNSTQLFSIIFAIIYNCFWGLLFCFFRHRNNGEKCITLSFWSLLTEIYFFSVALYKIAIELPVYHRALGRWKEKLFSIAEKVEFILSIIILIGLSYAYFKFEECNGLRNFVLFYLIVTYVVLGIYLISMALLITNKSNNSG